MLREEHTSTSDSKEPFELIQEAIKKLSVFAQAKSARLEVDSGGTLKAEKVGLFQRLLGALYHYIGPLFSNQAKHQQARRLKQIKEEILHARDTLKSHTFLIEKLKEGNESQKKLAQLALDTIHQYNLIVSAQPSSLYERCHFYNVEHHYLLQDAEIKNQAIDLPQNVSVRFDSHPNLPLQNSINELYRARTRLDNSSSTRTLPVSGFSADSVPQVISTTQFMRDTFRMKAIRMLQSHHPHSITDILSQVKHTPIEVDEENSDSLAMSQKIEFAPGYYVLLTGAFKKKGTGSKFICMPVLESFRLTSEMIHTGFPYPAQHSGWSLHEKLIAAQPLRTDQAAQFQAFIQKKRKLSHALLFDSQVMAYSKQLHKAAREACNEHQVEFLALHRQFNHTLAAAAEVDRSSFAQTLDDFFEWAAKAPSPFELLSRTQQQINEHFIKHPALLLEENWISSKHSPLRIGSNQDKQRKAMQILQHAQEESLRHFEGNDPLNRYIQLMGPLLGKAAQAIILQYQSEKISFAPPMLTDFERKLQTCAFHQAELFIQDFEKGGFEKTQFARIKEKCEGDMLIFKSSSVEDLDFTAADLTNVLEVYFNSRFYAMEPRRWST